MNQLTLWKNFLNDFFLDIKQAQKNQEKVVVLSLIDIDLLYFKCHKIKLNCGGLYTDSPEWIQNKSNDGFYQKT